METPAEETQVAPTHLDVHERFSTLQVITCGALGSVAIVAGIVLGLLLQNN
ncbi:MAG: hypothetical protein KC482_09855 [Dehalococcoidia bacterium]|nr:hypothetical protein [Dehalococcoidia bacterium]MCA9845679.1 hypothetical protein [Dehalococcoidia bacterium]MCA9853885.1 hypothetical protein [Dehalococcoidia bacterium]